MKTIPFAHYLQTRKEFFEYWESINPDIKENGAKEKKLESVLLEQAHKMNHSGAVILNIPQQSYELITGWIPGFNHRFEHYMKEGFNYVEQQIHSTQISFAFQFVFKIFFETYYTTSIAEREKIELFFDILYRFENHKDAPYRCLFQHIKVFEMDNGGNLQYVIINNRNITYLKRNQDACMVIKKPNGQYHHYKFNSYNYEIVDFGEFSSRQLEILVLLANGLSSNEISKLLFISPHTVDGHRRNMLEMTNCIDTTALIVYCQMLGIL